MIEDSQHQRLRSEILFSQDELPSKEMSTSEKHFQVTDLVLCLGTSLQITPACDLPLKAIRNGGKVVIVNLQLIKMGTLEKHEFRPKQLLKQIVNIHIHLARGDKENNFPSIVKDVRLYNDQLFGAATDVLMQIGEDMRIDVVDFLLKRLQSKIDGSSSHFSDEFSYIHRFYLIPVPDTKKWPGLLQIPAPEFRAVRTDSLPFSDLPDESCRKTVSCLVSILLTAKKSVSCTKFGRVYVADYGCLESI